MINIKKLITIIIIFLITGCSYYTELNDLSIVNTLGIDYLNNKYVITLSIIENDNITSYTASNNNISKAMNSIYQSTNKKLYLSHIDLLILTDNSINNKLIDILNTFLENNEYRNNFQTIYMNSDDLKTFFNNNTNAKDITNLINTNTKETSIVHKKEIEELIKDILIDNNSYLPTIIYKNNNLYLNGYTLIKNKKIYSSLNKEDSIIFNLLINKLNNAYTDNIKIYNSNTKISTNKNRIKININITTNTSSKKKINNLKVKIDDFITKYQTEDYDILRLTELIKKNDYTYYKKEKKLLSKIKFNINISNKKENNTINGDLDE